MFYISEGRSLTANIANYINKGRYSNNPVKSIAPSILPTILPFLSPSFSPSGRKGGEQKGRQTTNH